MAAATETAYYMDGYLKDNLDLIVQRTDALWDNLIIIDGLERAGKSTVAITCAAYLAEKLKRPFDAEKVFFSIDDLTNFAQSTREQVIIWDEAALGGMGQQWATSEQLKLKQLLITCGKYRHILIFIIPDFTILGKYFAVHRSVALLRVYSPDNITRGYFRFYNIESKKLLYDAEKKGLYYNHGIHPSFKGRFTKNENIIDLNLYEKRKDEAIQKIGKDSKKTAKAGVLDVVQAIHETYKVPLEFFACILKKQRTNLATELIKAKTEGTLVTPEDIAKAVDKLGKRSKAKLSAFQMPGAEAEGEE